MQKISTIKMSTLAILTAIVAVLSLLSNFIHIGPFPITLVLTPIIIGGALYGPGAGAYLGFVFGFMTMIAGLFGWDAGSAAMIQQNFLFYLVVDFGKAMACGWTAALVYKAIVKKNSKVASVLAAVTCPVVNTGIFILLMFILYIDLLESWAGGQKLLYFCIVGLAGVNFLIELGVNLILSSTITFLIKAGKKSITGQES